MRYWIFAIFVMGSFSVVDASLASSPSGETFAVTCRLPNDRQIWPLPKPNVPTVVDAEFVSSEEVLRIRKGNWIQSMRLITFRPNGAQLGAPQVNQLTFLFICDFPIPESGIRAKLLLNPFIPNTKARFWISKQGNNDVWDIQTYEISNQRMHWQPGIEPDEAPFTEG
jgi:hypothetical protein